MVDVVVSLDAVAGVVVAVAELVCVWLNIVVGVVLVRVFAGVVVEALST